MVLDTLKQRVKVLLSAEPAMPFLLKAEEIYLCFVMEKLHSIRQLLHVLKADSLLQVFIQHGCSFFFFEDWHIFHEIL